MDSGNSHEEEQQITPETVEQFNRVCQEATDLMLSYKQQSEDLKKQISSMVNIYNQNADPSQAVPVQKIMEITNVYEKQMKEAHNQYQKLEGQLKKEEEQRNSMIGQIGLCFEKLQKMEKILREKKAKKQAADKQAAEKAINQNQAQ